MFSYPVEYALVEFAGNKFTGKIVPELLALADRGVVHFVDIIFIRKEQDGTIGTLELSDLDPEMFKAFQPLTRNATAVLTQDDIDYAASRLPNNSSAAMFLWEDIWMDGIRKAIGESGGKLVDRFQISQQVIDQLGAEIRAK